MSNDIPFFSGSTLQITVKGDSTVIDSDSDLSYNATTLSIQESLGEYSRLNGLLPQG